MITVGKKKEGIQDFNKSKKERPIYSLNQTKKLEKQSDQFKNWKRAYTQLCQSTNR